MNDDYNDDSIISPLHYDTKELLSSTTGVSGYCYFLVTTKSTSLEDPEAMTLVNIEDHETMWI